MRVEILLFFFSQLKRMCTKYTLCIIPRARAYVKLLCCAESKADFSEAQAWFRDSSSLRVCTRCGWCIWKRALSSFFKCLYSVHVQLGCLQKKTPKPVKTNPKLLKIKTALSKSRACTVLCRWLGSGGSMGCFQSPSLFQVSLWLLTGVCQMFYSLSSMLWVPQPLVWLLCWLIGGLPHEIIGNASFPQLIFKIPVDLGWSWGAF